MSDNYLDPRDAARAYFSKHLSYEDITTGELLTLTMTLNKRLKEWRKAAPDFPMSLSSKMKFKRKSNGSIIEAYLFVNGSYFTRRECISFNKDGYIGFCGWAAPGNTKPILEAFCTWVDMCAGDAS
jgi:hypothetical protein